MNSFCIRNGLIVTMDSARTLLRGDLRVRHGEIVEMGTALSQSADEDSVDATDCFVIPGLIQTHTHLCQTLFRGLADDLELLDWLQLRIWPFESAHDSKSLRASARLGLLEMQSLGTTSILDMGTVRLHEEIFQEAKASGMRYWGGPCLMDLKATSGPLHRPTQESLDYCEQLIREWHRPSERIQFALSPRFAVSCTEKIMRAVVQLQELHGLLIHTHASENKGEIALVKKRTGLDNIHYLKKLGLLNSRTVIAHGIHMNRREVDQFIKCDAGLAHCPSSNLKLASGVAPIADYLKRGMKVGIGSDGAPCNNQMDPFVEMRLAALIQKPLFGPTALPASQAFQLATIGGAKVLGAEDQIGSLEVGKQADIVVVERQHPSVSGVADPYSALVYSCSGRDVRDVWISGHTIVRGGVHQIFSRQQVNAFAASELSTLLQRLS